VPAGAPISESNKMSSFLGFITLLPQVRLQCTAYAMRLLNYTDVFKMQMNLPQISLHMPFVS
jgi:hypothetical protein